ncbi:MAG: extracellular solute-binding protein [Hahellaceae bacterium]|nr:extracellular solute-binding protein [Hahellaceae bacterium]
MLRRAFVLVCSLFLLSGCSEAPESKVLRVLTWPGYADPDLVATFEQQYQVRVEVTYINTDDELWARASADGGQRFDLAAVNTAELQRFLAAGLSQPVRIGNIPNTLRQLPRFQHRDSIPGLIKDGNVFAIPYTYSTMGLIYDRQRVNPPPTTMSALWDSHYRGQVLAYDGSSHNFTIAAMTLGFENPFHLSEEQFRATTRRLVALRQNALTFYDAPEEAAELFRRNPIALVFGNYGMQQVKQLRDQGGDIGYVLPREGVLAWLDCWTILQGAKDRALAEAWINYTLEASVSNALSERQGLPNTVTESADLKDEDKIVWLQPVEDAARRAQLWLRIRSGEREENF